VTRGVVDEAQRQRVVDEDEVPLAHAIALPGPDLNPKLCVAARIISGGA